jgi:hypothetical protein
MARLANVITAFGGTYGEIGKKCRTMEMASWNDRGDEYRGIAKH